MLAKPQTYMNRSGECVEALAREYGIAPADLIVINDDLDLPFGRIRIRPSGSAGGHRGLVSIMENLAGAQFHRVRIGIGRPPEGTEPADYVLEPFNSVEIEGLSEVVARAADSVSCSGAGRHRAGNGELQPSDLIARMNCKQAMSMLDRTTYCGG